MTRCGRGWERGLLGCRTHTGAEDGGAPGGPLCGWKRVSLGPLETKQKDLDLMGEEAGGPHGVLKGIQQTCHGGRSLSVWV